MSKYRKSIRISGVLVQKTFENRLEAEQWYKSQRMLPQSSVLPVTDGLSLKQFYSSWIKTRFSFTAPSSAALDRARFENEIIPQFGDRLIGDITSYSWTVFLSNLKQKNELSDATINRYRSLLHKFFQDALFSDLVSINPISKTPKSKEPVTKSNYLQSKEQVDAYLSATRAVSRLFHLFALISLNTGMRAGEVLALSRSDLLQKAGMIRVWRSYDTKSKSIQTRTKGKSERYVGLTKSILSELNRLPSSGSPQLFDLGNRQLPSLTWLRRKHEKALKAAGLGTMRLHDLRHTYASHFVMNGGSVYALQAILGHSSPKMVERYSHLTRDYLLKCTETVSFGPA